METIGLQRSYDLGHSCKFSAASKSSLVGKKIPDSREASLNPTPNKEDISVAHEAAHLSISVKAVDSALPSPKIIKQTLVLHDKKNETLRHQVTRIREENQGKPVYYIEHPDQLIELMNHFAVTSPDNYVFERGHGPLAALYNPETPTPVIIINFEKMTPKQATVLNELLNDPPVYQGRPVVNVTLISLISQEKLEKEALAPDLNSRLAPYTLAPSPEVNAPPVLQILDNIDHPPAPVLELHKSENWRDELIGSISLDANGHLVAKEGRLVEIIKSQGRGLVLKNALTENSSFLIFMDELQKTRHFVFNDQEYTILPDFVFYGFSGYSQLELQALNQATKYYSGPLQTEPPNSLRLNSENIEQALTNFTILPTGVMAKTDGLLNEVPPGTCLHLTSDLSSEQWFRLLFRIKELNNQPDFLANPITLLLDTGIQLPSEITPPAVYYSPAKTLNIFRETALQNGVQVVRTSDELYTKQQIERFNPNSLTIDLTRGSTVSELIDPRTLVSLQHRQFEQKETHLLHALREGRPIIIQGLANTPELEGYFDTLLSNPPYLIINGHCEQFLTASITFLLPDSYPASYLSKTQVLAHQPSRQQYLDRLKASNPDWRQETNLASLEQWLDLYTKIPHSEKSPVPQPENWALFNKIAKGVELEHTLAQGSSTITTAHWQKAINSILIKEYRSDPELYRYLKTCAALIFNHQPEQKVDLAQLQKIVSNFDRKEELADHLWECAATLSPAVLRSLGINPTNLDFNLPAEHRNRLLNLLIDLLIQPTDPANPQLIPAEFFQHLFGRKAVVSPNVAPIVPEFRARNAPTQRFDRRLERLKQKVRQFPIVTLLGAPSAGKSYIAEQIAKELTPNPSNRCTPLSLGPDTRKEDLLGHWEQSGDILVFVDGPLTKWAKTQSSTPDEHIVLVLDEFNLAPKGVLGIFQGLIADPPYLVVNGERLPISRQHRIILTGNPASFAGRKTDAFLRAISPVSYYLEMEPDSIRDLVLAKAIPDQPKVQALLVNTMERIKTVLPDHFFTGRDFLDILRFMQSKNPHFADLEPAQLGLLIRDSVLASLGGEMTPSLRQAVMDWFQIEFNFPPNISVIPKSFTSILDELTATNPHISFAPPSVRDLAFAVWQRLETVETDLAKLEADIIGKRCMMIEGPPGRGKDLIVEALLRYWQSKHPGDNHSQPLILNCQTGSAYTEMLAKVKQAQEEGRPLVISELNILPSEVIEGLFNAILTGQAAPGFFFFVTINPAEMTRREKLSTAFQSRLDLFKIPDYTNSELPEVLTVISASQSHGHAGITRSALDQIANFHSHLQSRLQEAGKRMLPTTRDLKRVLKESQSQPPIPWQIALEHNYQQYLLALGISFTTEFDQSQRADLSTERTMKQKQQNQLTMLQARARLFAPESKFPLTVTYTDHLPNSGRFDETNGLIELNPALPLPEQEATLMRILLNQFTVPTHASALAEQFPELNAWRARSIAHRFFPGYSQPELMTDFLNPKDQSDYHQLTKTIQLKGLVSPAVFEQIAEHDVLKLGRFLAYWLLSSEATNPEQREQEFFQKIELIHNFMEALIALPSEENARLSSLKLNFSQLFPELLSIVASLQQSIPANRAKASIQVSAFQTEECFQRLAQIKDKVVQEQAIIEAKKNILLSQREAHLSPHKQAFVQAEQTKLAQSAQLLKQSQLARIQTLELEQNRKKQTLQAKFREIQRKKIAEQAQLFKESQQARLDQARQDLSARQTEIIAQTQANLRLEVSIQNLRSKEQPITGSYANSTALFNQMLEHFVTNSRLARTNLELFWQDWIRHYPADQLAKVFSTHVAKLIQKFIPLDLQPFFQLVPGLIKRAKHNLLPSPTPLPPIPLLPPPAVVPAPPPPAAPTETRAVPAAAPAIPAEPARVPTPPIQGIPWASEQKYAPLPPALPPDLKSSEMLCNAGSLANDLSRTALDRATGNGEGHLVSPSYFQGPDCPPNNYYRISILDGFTLQNNEGLTQFSPSAHPFQVDTLQDLPLSVMTQSASGTPYSTQDIQAAYHQLITQREKVFIANVPLLLSNTEWVPLPSLFAEERLLAMTGQPELDIKYNLLTNQTFVRLKNPTPSLQGYNLTFICQELPNSQYSRVNSPQALKTFCQENCPPAPEIPTPLTEYFDLPIDLRTELATNLDSVLRPLSSQENYYDRLAAIYTYCTDPQFQPGALSFDTRFSGLKSKALLDLIAQQKGACRHRSAVFLALAHYFHIPVRMVGNFKHAFVEVYLPLKTGNGQWIRLDLGGAAAASEQNIPPDTLPSQDRNPPSAESQELADRLKDTIPPRTPISSTYDVYQPELAETELLYRIRYAPDFDPRALLSELNQHTFPTGLSPLELQQRQSIIIECYKALGQKILEISKDLDLATECFDAAIRLKDTYHYDYKVSEDIFVSRFRALAFFYVQARNEQKITETFYATLNFCGSVRFPVSKDVYNKVSLERAKILFNFYQSQGNFLKALENLNDIVRLQAIKTPELENDFDTIPKATKFLKFLTTQPIETLRPLEPILDQWYQRILASSEVQTEEKEILGDLFIDVATKSNFTPEMLKYFDQALALSVSEERRKDITVQKYLAIAKIAVEHNNFSEALDNLIKVYSAGPEYFLLAKQVLLALFRRTSIQETQIYLAQFNSQGLFSSPEDQLDFQLILAEKLFKAKLIPNCLEVSKQILTLYQNVPFKTINESAGKFVSYFRNILPQLLSEQHHDPELAHLLNMVCEKIWDNDNWAPSSFLTLAWQLGNNDSAIAEETLGRMQHMTTIEYADPNVLSLAANFINNHLTIPLPILRLLKQFVFNKLSKPNQAPELLAETFLIINLLLENHQNGKLLLSPSELSLLTTVLRRHFPVDQTPSPAQNRTVPRPLSTTAQNLSTKILPSGQTLAEIMGRSAPEVTHSWDQGTPDPTRLAQGLPYRALRTLEEQTQPKKIVLLIDQNTDLEQLENVIKSLTELSQNNLYILTKEGFVQHEKFTDQITALAFSCSKPLAALISNWQDQEAYFLDTAELEALRQ